MPAKNQTRLGAPSFALLSRMSEMGPGRFITFEGTEGGGKSTQITLLADRLRAAGRQVCVIREPGGTQLGEEIRHTLKHGAHSHDMTPETELLLMNASRAQLVKQVIRPALQRGDIILCDRFADSTIAYQGFGREMGWERVQPAIDLAVGDVRPHLTLLLSVPITVSEARRASRSETTPALADRFEQLDRAFFERVERGFQAVAAAAPSRVKVIDATQSVESVSNAIWNAVQPLIT